MVQKYLVELNISILTKEMQSDDSVDVDWTAANTREWLEEEGMTRTKSGEWVVDELQIRMIPPSAIVSRRACR